MSIDTGIDFSGVRFKNPFLLAASPATSNSERIKKAARAGWAGVVTTTVWARPMKSRIIKHPGRTSGLEATCFMIESISICLLFRILGVRWRMRNGSGRK